MVPNRVREESSTYPTWIGFIFIFNLIVGTGALTLPAVFAKAGWLLSLIVVILLAVISYITVTFIIEAMSCANAVKNWQNLQVFKRSYNFENESDSDATESMLPPQRLQDNANMPTSSSNTDNLMTDAHLERMPLCSGQRSIHLYYNLDNKFELGEMAVLFFNDIGRMLFYLCIVIYLYGDLSIYSAAVAKSLRDIACDSKNTTTPVRLNRFGFADSEDDDRITNCWNNHTLSRLNVYRLFLIGFTLVLGPFAAFSVQKTKYLQIVTVIFRWLAFTFMISIAIKLLFTTGAQGHPPAFNVYGLPSLFGACVYSFMCHHSLPSLLTPIRNKFSLRKIILGDYVLICTFYIVLAMTGIFAFKHLEDLYTLNFIPIPTDDYSFKAELLLIIDYFLALFPVFTLSASFPIIAITLRNNLQTLFLDMARFETYNLFVRRILFPMCTVVPPFVITYFTESLTSLVAFTGSYAGAGIQYLIPIALIYFARRTCKELLGSGVINQFQSPFRSTYWLVFVLIWTIACMCLVTINLFIDPKAD